MVLDIASVHLKVGDVLVPAWYDAQLGQQWHRTLCDYISAELYGTG